MQFETPKKITCEDGERYWLVKGHDRDINERYALMSEHGVYLQSAQTWARTVPSGGNPDARFYVNDGDHYQGQRGAFPCTVYCIPPRCEGMDSIESYRERLVRAKQEAEMLSERGLALRWQRVERLTAQIEELSKIQAAFSVMMSDFQNGRLTDPVSEVLATLT